MANVSYTSRGFEREREDPRDRGHREGARWDRHEDTAEDRRDS